MRAWRTAEGFLVEGGPTSAAIPHGIEGYLPEGPWRELRDFRRLGPSGELKEVLDVRVGSLEDELYLIAYGIVEDRLDGIYLSVFTGRTFRVRHDTRPILEGLRELPPEEAARVTSGPPSGS